jgi:hypothetical protein
MFWAYRPPSSIFPTMPLEALSAVYMKRLTGLCAVAVRRDRSK